MPHRHGRDALREAREGILARLAAIELDDGEAAHAERATLLGSLEEVRRSLELCTPRSRPLAASLRIVRGCDAKWEHMVGDARVRHCGRCDREVYDLTALDPDEIERFLAERRDALPCMRLWARADGRYQNGPCRPAERRRLARAVALAGAMGLTGLMALLSPERSASATAQSARPASALDVDRFFREEGGEVTSEHASMPGDLGVMMGAPAYEPPRAPARLDLWVELDGASSSTLRGLVLGQFHERRAAIESAAEELLAADPEHRGRVTIPLAVRADGTVIPLLGSRTDGAFLALSMTSWLRLPSAAGQTVTVIAAYAPARATRVRLHRGAAPR